MNNLQTHRVYFKNREIEPILIDDHKAHELTIYRSSPNYNPKTMITLPGYQCEAAEIRMIEKLGAPKFKYAERTCTNALCSNWRRQHGENEKCEYDISGACEECGKDMIHRDCEASRVMFKRIVCREHSPLKHADELLPGDWTPELARMRGLAAYHIGKGLNDEEVMAAVNRDLASKRKIADLPERVASDLCEGCGHSKYHHSDLVSKCADCDCEIYS